MGKAGAHIGALMPVVIYFIVYIFYLAWTYHYNKCISEEEENADYIKPEKYCVEVEGFEDR